MIEKRFYPRVTKQFSAVIENDDGVQLNVVVMDTSSQGLCVQCNTFARDLITPRGSFIRDDGKPVELYVWMDLPFESGQAERISVRCHVSFSRRESNTRCKIGMRYMDLDDRGYHALVKFIESEMASNDA